MKSSFGALILAAPVWAHTLSMSTGELRVDGPTAVYELRMPMYEVADLANRETAVIDSIRFGNAQRTSAKCQEEGGSYVCRAMYEFPGLVDRLQVECGFYRITVPNHVHLLYAVQGANSDQVVFDQSFPRMEIRFRPPSRAEILARGLGAGFLRAMASPAGLLFLMSLVIAARSGRESVLLAAMFVAGEWLARPLAPRIPWQFSPRFLEAAMALTVAYLAVEILTLPEAGQRWLVVFVLGLFHGLYFGGFPLTYLTGATATQAAVIAALWLLTRRVPQVWRRRPAWALLAAGLGWFAVRLIR
jgi:HupE/UreJ protein